MLGEIRAVRQDDADRVRYWFQDDFIDLFAWTDSAGEIVSFQLCYDRLKNERVLQWDATNGFSHRRVDDGEKRPGHKMAPLMMADGGFAAHTLAAEFEQRSADLDVDWRRFMLAKLQEASAHFAAHSDSA